VVHQLLIVTPISFECNIGNGCNISEGIDVVFPNPGASPNSNARICLPETDPFVRVGNDVTYSQGNYGNSTQGHSDDGVGMTLQIPHESEIAVGVFMGLGGAVVVGLIGYYAWTWHKVRSMAAGKPTKA
jgi:hypothetical protein